MLTRIVVVCLATIFTAVPADAGEKRRAAAIFLAAPELNDLYCNEQTASVLAAWKNEHPKPANAVQVAAWKKEFAALKVEAEKAEKTCEQEGTFSLGVTENLITGLSKLGEFELMGSEEVVKVARDRMAGRPLIACFTDSMCLDAIGSDLRAAVIITGELTQHGDGRTLVVKRFESAGLKFEEVKRAKKVLPAENELKTVFGELYEPVDELFGNPGIFVSAQIGSSGPKAIESGNRIEVGDAPTWKVSVEGRRCKGIKIGEVQVTDQAIWSIENDASYAGRDISVSCTNAESLRTAKFAFSIVLPQPQPEPAAEQPEFKRDPACATLEKQFATYKERSGGAFAVTHVEAALKSASQQCKTDARLLLAVARALLDVSTKDPFALGKAVQYYQQIAALKEQLDAEDQKRVDQQVEFFAKTFFPVMVTPDREAGWSGSGKIAVEFTGFVNPKRKEALNAMRVYFVEHEVDLPLSDPLYFPTMQNGDTVTLNGVPVLRAPGAIATTIKVPPGKSEPLNIEYGAALAGAVGRGSAEGAYSRADISVQYPLAVGPVTVNPRVVAGGMNAFGGVAFGAEERWSHAGAGGLIEWPVTGAFRLYGGATGLWAFGRGFEVDPEAGLIVAVSKELSIGAAWLRPVTFWDDAKIAGVGLGLIRIGWHPK